MKSGPNSRKEKLTIFVSRRSLSRIKVKNLHTRKKYKCGGENFASGVKAKESGNVFKKWHRVRGPLVGYFL